MGQDLPRCWCGDPIIGMNENRPGQKTIVTNGSTRRATAQKHHHQEAD